MCGRDEFMHDERWLHKGCGWKNDFFYIGLGDTSDVLLDRTPKGVVIGAWFHDVYYPKLRVDAFAKFRNLIHSPFNGGHMASNKLSRSEQKRFNEVATMLGQWMHGTVSAIDVVGMLANKGFLDLRSPARKAAEAGVLEAAKMRFACCSLATHQLLDSEVRALNDVIASESAPSVEWRKVKRDVAWFIVEYCDNVQWTGIDYHVPTEAAADVLVAHLNDVESGKC